MANKHLSIKPKKITEDSWWYEEAGGINVIVQERIGNVYQQTTHHKIPWRDIRRALARKDRIK